MHILLIDDEPDICQSLSGFLKKLGHSVVTAENGAEGLKIYHQEKIDLVITDIRMPVMDGLELLNRLKSVEQSPVDVIMVTGHGDMDNAVKALQYGAFDYLQKPINVRELSITLERANELSVLRNNYKKLKAEFNQRVDEKVHACRGEAESLRAAYLQEIGLEELCVFSDDMREVLKQAEKYSADRSIPVLVEGESGTGKELISRYIHHFNPERGLAPFVAINCGALSEHLIEAELFGHEAGAYTGATRHGRKGKLEAAHGGTIFLDEIGEMPLSLQVKLLRVLEGGHIYRLGGTREIPLDVRFICATNKDLQEMLERKTFRLDLYYRISIGNIKIPPLRERRDAILPFAHRFISRAYQRRGKAFEGFSAEAESFLRDFDWPGNVRQIKNAMERLALLKTDGKVESKDLKFLIEKPTEPALRQAPVPPEQFTDNFGLPEQSFDLEKLNRRIIQLALDKFSGNQSEAARYLGLTRRQLQGRISKLKVEGQPAATSASKEVITASVAKAELVGALCSHGAALVRVADSARLSGLETDPPDLLERYPRAVSIGVALSNSIMDQIDQHPTPLYSSHYGRVNALLDDLAIRATDMLQAGGAEAIPIPASMILDDKKWTSFISHKAVAIAAGVGWQGKSLLVVNPTYGPRLRLVTVLTDADLPPDDMLENRCGKCNVCRDNCPAQAIRGVGTTSHYNSRSEAVDLERCLHQVRDLNPQLPNIVPLICGVCISVCPWGRAKK